MSPVVKYEFRLPIEVDKKGKWFISTCPILNVRSQGTTESKAKENLIEALQLFVETCFEHGTLDQVLRDAGFKPRHRAISKQENVDVVAIPLTLSSPSKHTTAHRRAPQRAPAHAI